MYLLRTNSEEFIDREGGIMKDKVTLDPRVDYDSLKKRRYSDSPGYTFYVCPRCGREYLATFITESDGEVKCIDCWNKP